jgi:predicted transposase/invertase (TIGR01784 family)
MQAVFADPKTDFVFKRIFGTEARKPLLVALLNHLLELEGDREIRHLEHLSTEQHVDVPELKLSIVDVKCTDATGRRFVVEMQVLKVEGFEKRVVYNASKAYVMQLRNADEYPTLCDVVGVTICNFNLWPEKNADGAYGVPMLSRWRMQERHGGALGLSQVQYVFLELPKYGAAEAPQSLVEKWAYFFREAKNLDVVPPTLSEGPFREALEVARAANFTTSEWDAYERSKMAEQDARGALSLARTEARSEGKAEGRAEGEAKGKAEAVLAVLDARGIALTAAQQSTVSACSDVPTLDRWLRAAVHVAEGGALFE